jgi:hypothetical protein
MAKRRGGRFKKMLGLGFISFEKVFSSQACLFECAMICTTTSSLTTRRGGHEKRKSSFLLKNRLKQ